MLHIVALSCLIQSAKESYNLQITRLPHHLHRKCIRKEAYNAQNEEKQ